ncbi:hypothetical protein Agub_g2159 [Astrephomene gubernaculifera]|uniref:Protein kinase domain-containing protein n=1 Tax=Astrephomene gubernaculifera TaxID=47775 RepID=A0AAD3DGN8_9CHLO|nr:hypothetical protein Agub_g2159 [Astrephomene gubernaculifera]
MAAVEPDALVSAILRHQTTALLRMLRSADATVRDQSGLTPLHHAVLAGNVEAVHALLDLACKRTRPLRHPGGSPSTAVGSPWDLVTAPGPPPSRPSPLHLAAERSENVLRILLGHSSLTTAGTSFLGITLSSRPQTELLRLRDARGWSLLHYAVSRANHATLRFLLQHFSEGNGGGSRGCGSGGGVIGGSEDGALRGCGVDIADSNGHTALHHAALLGHAECCRLLLKAGADQAAVSGPPEGALPVHLAVCGNHTAVVDILFRHAVAQHGFRAAQAVLLRPNSSGLTALHVATLHAAVDAARRLLHLVFPFDTRGPVDRTAFHLAALKGCTPMLNMLVRHSTPLQRELHDAEGFTAAHLAAAAGRLDALRVLAAGGCNMNARAVAAPAAPPNCEGWTPLHCAVRRGDVAAIELLVTELGADPHAKDDCGRTPCDLAVAVAASSSRHGSGCGVGASGSGVHNMDDAGWSPLDGMAMEPDRDSEGGSAERIPTAAGAHAVMSGWEPAAGFAADNLQGPSIGVSPDGHGDSRLVEGQALEVLQTFLRLLHEPLARRSARLAAAVAASTSETSPLQDSRLPSSVTLPGGDTAAAAAMAAAAGPASLRSLNNGGSSAGSSAGTPGTASPTVVTRLGSVQALRRESAPGSPVSEASRSPRRWAVPDMPASPLRSRNASGASAAAPGAVAAANGTCLCHQAAALMLLPPPDDKGSSLLAGNHHRPSMALSYAAQMLAGPAATPTRASPFSKPAVQRRSPFQPPAMVTTVNNPVPTPAAAVGTPAAPVSSDAGGGPGAVDTAAPIQSPFLTATKPSPFVAATRPSPFAAAATRPSPFLRQPPTQPSPPPPPPPPPPQDSPTEAASPPEARPADAANSRPGFVTADASPTPAREEVTVAVGPFVGLVDARSSAGGGSSSREALSPGPSTSASDAAGTLCVISPINNPCGYSALNRAILLQRHALAEALLATLPAEGQVGGLLVVSGGPAVREVRNLPSAMASHLTLASTAGLATGRNLATHAQLLLPMGTSSADAYAAEGTGPKPGAAAAAAAGRMPARPGSSGAQLPPPGPSGRSKRPSQHPQPQPLLQQLLQYRQHSEGVSARDAAKRSTTDAGSRQPPLVPLGGPGGSLPPFAAVPPLATRDLVPSLLVWDEVSEVFRTQPSNHTNREWLHWPGEPHPATGWLLVELMVMEAGSAGGHVWLGVGPTPELFLPVANESTGSSTSHVASGLPTAALTGSGAATTATASGLPAAATSLMASGAGPLVSATSGPGGVPATAALPTVALCSVMNHPSTHIVCIRDGQAFRGGVLSPDLGAATRLEARSGDTVALFWNRHGRTVAFTLNGRYCGRIAGLPAEEQLTPVLGLQSAGFVFKWRCLSVMQHGNSPSNSSGGGGGAVVVPPLDDMREVGLGGAGGRPVVSTNVDGLMVREQMLHEDPETPWTCKEPSITSLHFAAWAGNTRALVQLVRAKAFDPSEPDADGWTPLHFAALAGHSETVRLLLTCGCQPDGRSKCGSTPALMAAKYGRSQDHVVIMRLLAEAGAALDVRDARGRTLLMLAAKAGNLSMVELLLERGLDPSATDCQDREAQQYAGQHAAIFRLLRNAQAAQRAGTRKGKRHARTGASVLADSSPFQAATNHLKPPVSTTHGPAGAGGQGEEGQEDDGEEEDDDSEEDVGGNTHGRRQDQQHLPLLAERWRVGAEQLVRGRLIEQGAFGAVFEGTWCGARVAIKQVVRRPGSGGGGGTLAEREMAGLEREVAILAALPPHERIARMLGSVELPGEGTCLVMAYYPHTLQGVMQSERLRRSWLTPARRASIVRQLAEGLAFLHGLPGPRVIHRDLKPNNVLLEAAPSLGVKICDFGLSRILASNDVQSSSAAGHAFWMAPELLRAQPYDEKVDVYSYGVILYQVAYWVDDQLYGGLNKAQVDFQVVHGILRLQDRLPGGVDPAVQALVRDCLDEDPRARPAMAQVLERLAGVRELPQPSPAAQQQQQQAGQVQVQVQQQPAVVVVAGADGLGRVEQAGVGAGAGVGVGAGVAVGAEGGQVGGSPMQGSPLHQQQQ